MRDLAKQTIKIEARGTTRHTRTVHNPVKTGWIASDWGGTRYEQWSGWIKLNHEQVTVYGYTTTELPPTEWSNDTY